MTTLPNRLTTEERFQVFKRARERHIRAARRRGLDAIEAHFSWCENMHAELDAAIKAYADGEVAS